MIATRIKKYHETGRHQPDSKVKFGSYWAKYQKNGQYLWPFFYLDESLHVGLNRLTNHPITYLLKGGEFIHHHAAA